MIQRDESGDPGEFRGTRDKSRAEAADAIDIDSELRDDSFNFLPRAKVEKVAVRRKKRDTSRENEGGGEAARG